MRTTTCGDIRFDERHVHVGWKGWTCGKRGNQRIERRETGNAAAENDDSFGA